MYACMDTYILFLVSLTHLHKLIPLRKETCPLWQARKLFISSSLSLLLLMIEPYFPKVLTLFSDLLSFFSLSLSLSLSHCQTILTLFSKGMFCINEWPLLVSNLAPYFLHVSFGNITFSKGLLANHPNMNHVTSVLLAFFRDTFGLSSPFIMNGAMRKKSC